MLDAERLAEIHHFVAEATRDHDAVMVISQDEWVKVVQDLLAERTAMMSQLLRVK